MPFIRIIHWSLWVKRLGLFAGVAMALGACAHLAGPKTVTISQAQILGALGNKFPFNLQSTTGLNLIAAVPRLKTLPDANRMATEIDLGLAGRTGVLATVGASYGLRLDPSDFTVRLTDVKLDRFSFGGGEASKGIAMPAVMQQLIGSVVQEALQGMVAYRVSASDLASAEGLGYQPTSIRVVPQGLALTLTPKKP